MHCFHYEKWFTYSWGKESSLAGPTSFLAAVVSWTLHLTRGKATATVFEQSTFMWFLFAEAL